MNSFVNVQVRVMAGQAMSQLAAMQAQLNNLSNGFGGAARQSNNLGRSMSAMRLDAFGSRIQWVGRQLEYNFTLPIMLATGAAAKWALENETAMNRVRKVYGDAGHGAAELKAEVDALERSFVAISNHYGVAQKEVLDVAGAWASAGASGLALAKSVDLTMQTMILGEMGAAEATEALISIQAQYGQNVGELTKTIATLNMIENQTGIKLKGLVEGFSRAAGVARSTGVDIRHLGAMLAALTPAAGSAAQAGNALKTIFSRLISPTQETVEILDLMGIKTTDLSWKSAGMADRLGILATKFVQLEGASKKTIAAQAGVVSSVVASRWQVNRFDVLMRELANTHGYYQKALQSTKDAESVWNQKQKELGIVLDSNPRKLAIMTAVMKNSMATAITPMIPALVWIVTLFAKLATSFANLDPGVQKLIISFLLLLAAVGPLTRMTGAMVLLFSQLGVVLGVVLAPVRLLGGLLWWIVGTPIIAFLRGIGIAAVAGIGGGLRVAGSILVWFGGVMQIALLTAALKAGAVWRTGMGLLATITAGGMTLMSRLWRRFWLWFNLTAIAGMRALGVAYRAGMVFLATLQMTVQVVMLGIWRKFWAAMVLMTTAGWKGILAVYRKIIPLIRAASTAVAAAATGPWGMLALGIIILIIAFWDELKKAWKVIVQGTINAFNNLPKGVRAAMQSVINVIERAVMYIYELFSWMNPWAKHSPSLVDNVTTGVAEIKKQYGGLSSIGDIFRKAGMSLEEFGQIVQKLKKVAQLQDIANQRKDLMEMASGAIPMFDKLVSILGPLQNLLSQIGAKVAAQEAVVAKWAAKLEVANAALEKQEKILDSLQQVADKYQQQLNEAQARLDGFANAPIEGMKAMSDAIFDNQMQQKKLRLEMMKMEDAIGPLDELQGKIDAINGQMEMLSGEQNALRDAGAGSEILKYYDDQIGKLEDQQQAIEDQAKPLQDMSDALDELARKGEMLDLENSLKFDPLKKQIEDAANAMKELPFDEIMAGVISNKAEVDRLTAAYNQAAAAVAAQQAVVDQYKAARDAIQATYDMENAKLTELQNSYTEVETKIRDIESALQDMGAAARAAADAAKAGAEAGGGSMSPGAQNFKDAAGGSFPDPGGFAQIGREGGWEDQSKQIDEFTKQMQDELNKGFGEFDMLKPIKDGWNKTWGWIKGAWNGIVEWFKSSFGGLGDQVGNPFDKLQSWANTAKNIWDGIKSAFKMVWDIIGPEVIEIGKQAWEGLQDAFKDIQPEIEKFRGLIGPLGDTLNRVFTVVKPILMVVLGVIMLVVKALLGAIGGAIGPFFRAIGDLIAGIVKIIRGVIEVIIGLWEGIFTGEWGRVWTGIKDIFSGIWQIIWGVIKNFVNMIWGAIKGFVLAIWDFIMWLSDELVGHSIIPDMVNAIVDWFKKMIKWVTDLIRAIVEWIVVKWELLWYTVKLALQNAKLAIELLLGKLKQNLQDKWNALKTFVTEKWNALWNGIKAVFTAVKQWVETKFEQFKLGLTIIWKALTKTVSDKWNELWKAVKDALTAVKQWVETKVEQLKATITSKWENLKNNLKAAWDWVWDQVKAKIEWAKGKIDSAIQGIKNIIDNVRTGWNVIVDAVKKKIDDLVAKFRGIKDRFSFGGMFDGIKSAFKSAINWLIEKWNNLSFPAVSIGGVQLSPSVGTPNIDYLARGGMIAKHAMAVIGEGRAGYPEYVIPTDPLHRRRAMALFNQLGGELGASRQGSTWSRHAEAMATAAATRQPTSQPVHHTEHKEVNLHFHGNLEFPNVKTSDDADRFIRHLESLAGGGE